MIYLDHAATTPVPREVADAMYAVLTERFGNPSSQYPLGLDMKKQVEAWRRTVADALGCNAGRLLSVRPGELGLRQSDALFQHVKQLPEQFEKLEQGGYAPDRAGELGALVQVMIDGAIISSMGRKDTLPLRRAAAAIPTLLKGDI